MFMFSIVFFKYCFVVIKSAMKYVDGCLLLLLETLFHSTTLLAPLVTQGEIYSIPLLICQSITQIWLGVLFLVGYMNDQ